MAPVVSPASQEILYCWATRETRVTQFSKIRPCGTTPLDTIQGETGESLNNPSQVKHLRLSALHICPLKLVLLKCPHQAWRDRNPLSPEQRLTVPFYCPLHCRECQLWFPFQEQANQLHSEPTNWTVGEKTELHPHECRVDWVLKGEWEQGEGWSQVKLTRMGAMRWSWARGTDYNSMEWFSGPWERHFWVVGDSYTSGRDRGRIRNGEAFWVRALKVRQVGTWDSLLQCLHLDKGLLQQQNTKKKLQGTKNSCVHVQWGKTMNQKIQKTPNPAKEGVCFCTLLYAPCT